MKDKTHRNEQVKRRRARIREMVRGKKDVPCHDCGQRYPYYVMQFDHRPEHVKVNHISKWMHGSGSLANLHLEMAKCDVVCANCHAERTHRRKQYYAGDSSPMKPPEDPGWF